VVSYINCSAEIKALSDFIVTSSNAEIIVNTIPKEQGIIFAPDKNLGAYLSKKLNREMVLWDGACMVHEIFSLEKILKLKEKHPEAKLIAHPECEAIILDIADYVGSTTNLLKYTIDDESTAFIVATETGILHKMQQSSPHKTFIPAPPNNACACNDCPHMKLNTLEKIYLCLKYELPELLMDEDLRLQAKLPIDRMLQISAQAGLK
jgi:quinolinate synthase